MVSSIAQQSTALPSSLVPRHQLSSLVAPHGGGTLHSYSSSAGQNPKPAPVRGCGLAKTEGPLGGSGKGLLASVHSSGNVAASGMAQSTQEAHHFVPKIDEDTLEAMSAEMSFSAIYMHELHRRRLHAPFYDLDTDARERELWRPIEKSNTSTAVASASNMPIICEDQEVNNGSNPSMPLLGQSKPHNSQEGGNAC